MLFYNLLKIWHKFFKCLNLDVEILRQQMDSHNEEKNFVLSKMDSLIQENNQLKSTVEEFEFEETFVKKRLTGSYIKF